MCGVSISLILSRTSDIRKSLAASIVGKNSVQNFVSIPTHSDLPEEILSNSTSNSAV